MLDEQARQLAQDESIALIDLTQLSIAAYPQADDLQSWFVDGTHFSETGAVQIAGIVASAISTSDLDLASFVRSAE